MSDEHIPSVSSCSISIASSTPMSLSSSRPPSQANDSTDGRDGLKFEEKLRICREKQEEDKQRRLHEFEMSAQQKERYRQQVEEERRRRIDELKVKDLEKRNAVEERKRLIWEAEQERKEAMLRRSVDRDNKLSAKRLAQRNNTSFVFGSSTPRTLDLDLPAIGVSRNQTLLYATPNRINHSDDNSKRRPISAYYSDDYNNISNANPVKPTETTYPLITTTTTTSNADTYDYLRNTYKYRSALYSEQTRACLTMFDNSGHDFNVKNVRQSSAAGAEDSLMTQSLVSLQGVSRGRVHHTELTPVMPRERIFASSTSRINRDNNRLIGTDSVKCTPKRAVSMTRLDQLAQPRRRYLEETLKSNTNLSVNSRDSLSPTRPMSSQSGSMEVSEVKRRVKPVVARKPRPLSIGSPYAVRVKVEDKVTEPTASAFRGSRSQDKQPQSVPQMRHNRAKSATGAPRPLSLISPDSPTPKPTPPRKPAHVKAAAMARKANKQLNVDNVEQITSPIDSGNDSPVISKQNSIESPVPSNESKAIETTISAINDDMNSSFVVNSSKKEVSEEEYKKMMAEKRKQAREQAEKEAEIERQRIEREKREEDEKIRKEEEEQKRLEEEQLRLIETQRKAEEERLNKAMEENRLREEEENRRKIEEQRVRQEKEDKEKRAKEEAEQQRRELEERLKRDEEERLARKKKLEAIMSRTRKTASSPRVESPSSPNETPEPNDHSNYSTPEKNREISKNQQNIILNEQKSDDLIIINTTKQQKPDLVEDVNRAVNNKQNNTLLYNHNNVNNNYRIDNSNNAQCLESSENLLDLNSSSNNISLDQLININYSQPIGGDLNSNPFSNGNAFTNGANRKSQEQQQPITDLLS